MSEDDKPVRVLPGARVALPGEFVSGESIADATATDDRGDVERQLREDVEQLDAAAREAEELSQRITLR